MCIGLSEIMKSTSRDAVSTRAAEGTDGLLWGGHSLTLEVVTSSLLPTVCRMSPPQLTSQAGGLRKPELTLPVVCFSMLDSMCVPPQCERVCFPGHGALTRQRKLRLRGRSWGSCCAL